VKDTFPAAKQSAEKLSFGRSAPKGTFESNSTYGIAKAMP